jgi:hypothetical protein
MTARDVSAFQNGPEFSGPFFYEKALPPKVVMLGLVPRI